jgi:hypothetical protein
LVKGNDDQIDEEVMLFDEPDKAKAAFETIAKLDEIESREKQFGGGRANLGTASLNTKPFVP